MWTSDPVRKMKIKKKEPNNVLLCLPIVHKKSPAPRQLKIHPVCARVCMPVCLRACACKLEKRQHKAGRLWGFYTTLRYTPTHMEKSAHARTHAHTHACDGHCHLRGALRRWWHPPTRSAERNKNSRSETKAPRLIRAGTASWCVGPGARRVQKQVFCFFFNLSFFFTPPIEKGFAV